MIMTRIKIKIIETQINKIKINLDERKNRQCS